jgi:hypothetical protein
MGDNDGSDSVEYFSVPHRLVIIEIESIKYVAIVFWMLSGAVPHDWEHEIVPKCNSAGKQKLRVSLEKGKPPFFQDPDYMLGDIEEEVEVDGSSGATESVECFPEGAARTVPFTNTFHRTMNNTHVMEVDIPFEVESRIQPVKIPTQDDKSIEMPNPYFFSIHHELYKGGKIESAAVNQFMKMVGLYKLDFVLLRAVDPGIKKAAQKAANKWGKVHSPKGRSRGKGTSTGGETFAFAGKKHKTT